MTRLAGDGGDWAGRAESVCETTLLRQREITHDSSSRLMARDKEIRFLHNLNLSQSGNEGQTNLSQPHCEQPS